jgi:hypothetical protein
VDAVALNPNVELQRVARGYLLWGFGGRRTTHLTAVLGGGHRVRLRVRRFPASLHSVAGWLAWVVPRHEAVRRVVGPGGRRLSQFPQSLAPATVALDGGLSLQGRLVPPGPAGLAAGPLPGDPDARLLIRHSGARICPEIDRPDPWEPSCDLPPVAPADATLLGRGTRRGDTFGGVVPASVTAVELRDAGHRVRVAAIPAGPAAGQWAGLVHVFLAQLPSLAVAQIRLLDSGGQTLSEQTVLPTYRTTTATQSRYRSRLTSRVPGGGRFVVGVDTEGDCLALLPRAHGRVAESGYSCETSAPELLVPCRPRLAAVVAGAKGRRRLWVGTSRGARISGRLVRVGHKHVWLAVAPVSAELRAVGWRDRRGRARRRSLGRVPAADRQCGYRAG